ncbi:hypothetical protein NC652_024687 [Populus alba x Populus x berolinensis]|nr:hypothetical protein NC652_024687 [Populus alba x Populus x berolinensis]
MLDVRRLSNENLLGERFYQHRSGHTSRDPKPLAAIWFGCLLCPGWRKTSQAVRGVRMHSRTVAGSFSQGKSNPINHHLHIHKPLLLLLSVTLGQDYATRFFMSEIIHSRTRKSVFSEEERAPLKFQRRLSTCNSRGTELVSWCSELNAFETDRKFVVRRQHQFVML